MKEWGFRSTTLAALLSLLMGTLFPCLAYAQPEETWKARVVSVEGHVEARISGSTQWKPVKMDDAFGAGDTIRSHASSRASVALPNGIILRLDQNSAVTFTGPNEEKTFIIGLFRGAAYFFTRMRRVLKVTTPFVNGSVEGTEFFLRVESDRTFLSVFEGTLLATNREGSLSLASGQSAMAVRGQPPKLRMVLHPRDAVAWTLYYPPVIEYYGPPRLTAVSKADAAVLRAALLLSVGQAEEAKAELEKALKLDPTSSRSVSLQSIIALAQNDTRSALALAKKAVEMDPRSPAGWIALSYAQQAHFDLQSSLQSVEEAIKVDPGNALARARLANLWMSLGHLDKALEAAKESLALSPDFASSHTVLGFAYLAQIRTAEAETAFREAIRFDQADPLPRLGLGLAKIRDGNLQEGREDIEIAVSLDPQSSLLRSYLGKAYFEEKRDKLASTQYTLAKELDPRDPTPWF